jgi:hypothetical protein
MDLLVQFGYWGLVDAGAGLSYGVDAVVLHVATHTV